MSEGNGRHGYRYIGTIHSSYINNGVYQICEDGRGVYMLQETSQYYSHNRGVYQSVYQSCENGRGVLGLNIPATVTIEIMDQKLMLMGELDSGLTTATISPITQVAVVDCWVSNFLLVLLTIMLTKMR